MHPIDTDWTAYSSAELARLAASYRHDNDDGSAFFFDAHDALWRYTSLDPHRLSAFTDADEARAWLESEIEMFEADGHESRAAFYRKLLQAGYEEPVIIGQVGTDFRLWDGWHRTAAAMARGERLPAIVGLAPTAGGLSPVGALRRALAWIDSVPRDAPLPTMPGFDRDWVDALLPTREGSQGHAEDIAQALGWAIKWIDAVPSDVSAQLAAFDRAPIVAACRSVGNRQQRAVA